MIDFKFRMVLCRGLVWVLFPLIPIPQAGCADWPQFLGPNRDGVSNETGWSAQWPPEGPRRLWQTHVGTGFASVSVVNNRVYAVGNRKGVDTIYCLDSDDGKVIWTHSYDCELFDHNHEGGPAAVPTVHGNRLYYLSKAGDAFGLDALTGELLWTRNLREDLKAPELKYGFSGSPLLHGELLYFDVGTVIALEPNTGKTVWTSPNYKAGYGSPLLLTLRNEPFLTIFNAPGLTLLNPSNGEEIAQRKWKSFDDCNCTTPVWVGLDRLFISSGYDRGCALLRLAENSRIETLWENKKMSNHFNNSVLWNGQLYGVDGLIHKDAAPLKCLDVKTGEVRWTAEEVRRASLIIVDGKIVAITAEGELVIAHAASDAYREIARSHVLGGKCWTIPVLAHGRIYCRNARGDLVCLDVRLES